VQFFERSAYPLGPVVAGYGRIAWRYQTAYLRRAAPTLVGVGSWFEWE